MRLQVKGKNVEVSDAIRSYAEEKLGRLERQLADPTQVELELAVERNPSIADNHRRRGDDLDEGADAAREGAFDRHARVDRPAHRQARAPGHPLPREAPQAATAARGPRASRRRCPTATDEEGGPVIVKTKQFTMHPMSAEEAVLAARAGRPRLLRLPPRGHRRDQRRLPAARRRLRADRAELGVGLFRRREPLHERLAREGGMDADPVQEPGPPGWMETGIHGVPRASANGTPSSPSRPRGSRATTVRFVALPDNVLLVEEGEDVEPLADALDDGRAAVPYRAEAARRERVAVGGRRPRARGRRATRRSRRRGAHADGRRRRARAARRRRRMPSARCRRSSSSGEARGQSYVVRATAARRRPLGGRG